MVLEARALSDCVFGSLFEFEPGDLDRALQGIKLENKQLLILLEGLASWLYELSMDLNLE